MLFSSGHLQFIQFSKYTTGGKNHRRGLCRLSVNMVLLYKGNGVSGDLGISRCPGTDVLWASKDHCAFPVDLLPEDRAETHAFLEILV